MTHSQPIGPAAGYDGLAERERRCLATENDPGWAAYRDALRELDAIGHQETKLLKSVAFSPL